MLQQHSSLVGTRREYCVEYAVFGDSSCSNYFEVRKHVSFYGSRSLIRAAFTSRYRNELIKEMNPNKDVQYMPFISMDPHPNEENMSDAELNMAVVKMMDLFNYPGKEHYSFKKKSCLDTKQPKPKPDFWPRQVRFTPLLSTDLAKIMESDTPTLLLQRREAFRIVLSHMREYYASLLRKLDSNSNGITETYETNKSQHLHLNGILSPIPQTTSIVESSRDYIDDLEPIVVVDDVQMCNTLNNAKTIPSYSLSENKSQLLLCQLPPPSLENNCTQQPQNVRECTSSAFPIDGLVSYNSSNLGKRTIPEYGSEHITMMRAPNSVIGTWKCADRVAAINAKKKAFHYHNISYEIHEPIVNLNQIKDEYGDPMKHIKNCDFPEEVAHTEEVEGKNDLILVDTQEYNLIEKGVNESEAHSHMVFEDNIVENRLPNRLLVSTGTDMDIDDEYSVDIQTNINRLSNGSTHYVERRNQVTPLIENHRDTGLSVPQKYLVNTFSIKHLNITSFYEQQSLSYFMLRVPQIVSLLKEALDIDAALAKSTPEDQILSAFEMYEEWPTLEFPDLGNTILDLFTKNIIDALRNVFRRRWEDSIDIPRGLAIERQATEIETILDSIRVLTHSASRKYQNEVVDSFFSDLYYFLVST
uniref:Histone deacetylase n=1 Tax=Heterorhabditis bacteriophora TaxID=37862 RepID=A0A1I7XEL5_HETBA